MPGRAQTAAAIAAIGFAVGLTGDATHIASGTTHYDWSGVPTLWHSAIWFPLLVAGGVLLAASTGDRAGLRAARRRTRLDLIPAAAAVLVLYALTSALRHEPATVSVVLTGALALLVCWWWDPSPGTLICASAAAVLGPLVEIGIVAIGAASYAPDADGLFGVAPWLPCLYFGAGGVASGLWRTVSQQAP